MSIWPLFASAVSVTLKHIKLNTTPLSCWLAEEESQPQPQSFASQHHTLAPGSEHSRSATPPLISGDHRAAAGQHDPEAAPAGDQPSFRGHEASDAQAFVTQHHVNNETPGDAESMLAQPLTSEGQTPGAQLAQNSDIGSTQGVGHDTQQSESQSTHEPHQSLTGVTRFLLRVAARMDF